VNAYWMQTQQALEARSSRSRCARCPATRSARR
jgi:hypothetical protein